MLLYIFVFKLIISSDFLLFITNDISSFIDSIELFIMLLDCFCSLFLFTNICNAIIDNPQTANANNLVGNSFMPTGVYNINKYASVKAIYVGFLVLYVNSYSTKNITIKVIISPSNEFVDAIYEKIPIPTSIPTK